MRSDLSFGKSTNHANLTNSTFKEIILQCSRRLMKLLLAGSLGWSSVRLRGHYSEEANPGDEPPARSVCCCSTSRTHGGVIHLKILPHTDCFKAAWISPPVYMLIRTHTQTYYIYTCMACGSAQLQRCSAASYIMIFKCKTTTKLREKFPYSQA